MERNFYLCGNATLLCVNLIRKKFNKIRKNDLYNKEKKRSYKRATQPIDTAGEDKGEKSINKMFAKLESVSDNNRLITEEISLMKNMINYNSKTQ